MDNRLDNHNPSGRCPTTSSDNLRNSIDGAIGDGPGGPARERYRVAAPPLRAKRSAAEHVLPAQAMDGVADGSHRAKRGSMHIFVTASRALSACSVHMPGRANVHIGRATTRRP